MESIIFEKSDGVAWVTLNRPRVLNAYNVRMRDELFETLGAIAEDPDVLVAVFRGAGERAFCAGADLTEFGSAPSQAIARKVRFERDIWARFLSMEKPLIAAIHGFCLGSGLEIALCCDIRWASDDARFGLPETGLGFIPAAGGTQTFPRVAGVGRGMHSLLTGEILGAPEALRMGLVSRLLPGGRVFSEAASLGRRLALLDAAVIRAAKEAVARGLDATLEQGLDIETVLSLRLAGARAREGNPR